MQKHYHYQGAARTRNNPEIPASLHTLVHQQDAME